MAERVWGINTGSIEEKATQAIEAIEEFFRSLGISTRLKIYTEDFEKAPTLVAQRLQDRGWTALGERRDITPFDVEQIVKGAL